MLNIINIAEKVNLIAKRLNWNIDVSNVMVFILEDINNSFYNGEYICIKSNQSSINQELDLVHEYMHHIQDQGCKLSYTTSDIKDDYYRRREEIDARLFTLLYIIDEFGIEGFNLLKDTLIKGISWKDTNLRQAIKETKDEKLKKLLTKEIA